MLRTRCVLVLVALHVGLAHSWDVAMTRGDQLEFTDGRKTHSEGVQFKHLTALAYDAVHNMLLFVDKQSDTASIFSFHISSKKFQSLVKRKSFENIQGLAFDPVKGLLFWTESNERSIYWISLKPGSKNNVYGNLLIKMDDEIPKAIAVDSCRGYIYWTNINKNKPTIERARFNGSEREVVVDNNIFNPVSLAIDQQTKKIYWADDEALNYTIESADLNGKNRVIISAGIFQHPYALTVSKDSIYWVDWGYKRVWQIPKTPSSEEPICIAKFMSLDFWEHKIPVPFGIAANYKIEDQTAGTNECEALTILSRYNSANNDSFNIPTDAGLFCVHGIKVSGKSLCNCTPGYTGERCDISVCQNYCFQGDCSVSDEGQPKCRCNAGYSGERCELYACHGYCLNNGDCSLNEEHQPVCQCVGNHEGTRCEAPISDAFTNTPTLDSVKRNLTLADLLSNWRKPTSKMFITVEV